MSELKTAKQLEFEIDEARAKRGQTSGQLIEHIIRLYGREFEKANSEIFRLRRGEKWTVEHDGAICGILLREGVAMETGLHFELCERLANAINDSPPGERKAQAALADLFAMIDEQLLVRNTSHDNEPDWTMRLAKFACRLAKASHALPPKQRHCNRHDDCDAADAKAKAAGRTTDHCHDSGCEDCFGK